MSALFVIANRRPEINGTDAHIRSEGRFISLSSGAFPGNGTFRQAVTHRQRNERPMKRFVPILANTVPLLAASPAFADKLVVTYVGDDRYTCSRNQQRAMRRDQAEQRSRLGGQSRATTPAAPCELWARCQRLSALR